MLDFVILSIVKMIILALLFGSVYLLIAEWKTSHVWLRVDSIVLTIALIILFIMFQVLR